MLNYLTVQDVIWINTQVSGAVQTFDYEALEDSVYCQYGYGTQVDLESQAARLMASIVSRAPFEKGNEATAFVATVTFLTANHRQFNMETSKATAWFHSAIADPSAGAMAQAFGSEAEHHEHAGIQSIASEILKRFSATVESLGSKDTAAA